MSNQPSGSSNPRNAAALRDIAELRADRRKQGDDRLQRALRTIRAHLDMDVAFISEFRENQRTFRYVDCDRAFEGMSPGVSAPLESTYCHRVVTGVMPAMSGNADVSACPEDPIITKAMPVGAYASIPIRLSDGSLYGTFCAIGVSPDESLNDRDLRMMQAFADMAAEEIEGDLVVSRQRREIRARVQSALDGDALEAVYQPIFDIVNNTLVGYEALIRFLADPGRGPDVWFSEAAEVGLDTALEMRALDKALCGLAAAPPGTYISVNASPSHIIAGDFTQLLQDIPCERVVLEITEHAAIHDYEEVLRACRTLRERGIRLAIDDAGSGYASFRHILSLSPDFIKLDASLTQNIESDRRRQALTAAFVGFASKTSSEIVAEGLETQAGLDTLRALGVTRAQGYLLGKPGPL